MDNRIGAQLYTVRNFCQNEKDLASTFQKLKQIGYKTVQVSGVSLEIPAKTVKSLADEAGLSIICTHLPYDYYMNRLDDVIAYQNDLGCSIAGLGSAPKSLRESKEGLFGFIKDFDKISKELKAAGILFGYHNHGFEFAKLDGKYVIDYIAEGTDPDSFSFILDVYWLAFAGIDPAKFIQKLGKRTSVLHYKDLMAKSDNTVTMCEVLEGNLEWDSIIAASKEAGCLAAMVEQDTCPGDPFDSLKISYDNLSKKGFN